MQDNALDLVGPLTSEQYDKVKAQVEARALKELGAEPTRKSVRYDMGPLFNPEDYFAIIVFCAAFVVSAIHIATLMGGIVAGLVTAPVQGGIYIAQSVIIQAHQIAFILLAETAMILFMVRWRLGVRELMESLKKAQGTDMPKLRPRDHLRRFLSVDLCLALLAVGFTLYANLESRLPFLESVMPPLFTIGIGIHLEHVFVELLHRQKTLGSLLVQRQSEWREAVERVRTSKEYRRLLTRLLWEALLQVNPSARGMAFTDKEKWALVQREISRETWYERMISTQEKLAPEVLAEGSQTLGALLEAVEQADDGINRIEVGGHWADLAELTWFNAEKNKSYGPYKAKSNMIGAIRNVAGRTGLQPA